MREVSNLGWPASPYSCAHRPAQRHQLLLTGLAIGSGGWAVAHLPVHRTRTLGTAEIRFGIHAVLDPGGAVGWLILEKVLLAAHRQAVALAGDRLKDRLNAVSARMDVPGLPCPGIRALDAEWPPPGAVLTKASAGRAQLIELDGLALPPAAGSLLAQYPVPAGQGRDEDPYLAGLVASAAAISLAAAALTGRHTIDAGVDLPPLLDAAAGDLLPLAALPTWKPVTANRGT
jgi:hypothetical protein